MPELPDLILYKEALESRTVGTAVRSIRIASPSLLRTVDPPPNSLSGALLARLSLLGKRLVFHFEGELFLVLHLMIAGRLHWKHVGAPLHRNTGSAAIDFDRGTVLLTESSTKKRASLHIVCGREALDDFDRGGINVLESSLEEFRQALARERHTLKRALTDPAVLSGIGNAYSDEILHHARLSPLRHTTQLTGEEVHQLYCSTQEVLTRWIETLRKECRGTFPEKVTAFRSGMAVHGRFGKPCPVCGSRVQKIVYAENECNYCARCQTEGRLLSDRSLARLLKDDWPRTIDELEAREHSYRAGSGPLIR